MPLTEAEEIEYLELKEAEYEYLRGRKLWLYYQDAGPLRRELYHKHIDFLHAGKDFPLRLMLKGNRVGGTEGFGCEFTYHLTGEYPPWWRGKRFDHPTVQWASGTTNLKVQEILQAKLFGTNDSRLTEQLGTGLIPREAIAAQPTNRPGLPGAIMSCPIRHVSGGNSMLALKSFEQGLEAFQGNEVHVIWADELLPLAIYNEMVVRITSTQWFEGGIFAWTVTPEEGMTDAIFQFLPDGRLPDDYKPEPPKFVTLIGWDDAPHLSDEAKVQLEASIPAYQLDARKYGIPALGAGVIYPIPEEEVSVDPFEIPKHWPRAYAMDVGWKWTAGLWGAYDPDGDTVYFYHEYKRSQVEPSVHAEAFKAPGAWIEGVHDPAARGRNQIDGRRLSTLYEGLGLHLHKANNAVEAGLYQCLEKLSTGRIKVFRTCQEFFREFRTYRREAENKYGHASVVKVNDHLMDCMRYWELSAREVAKQPPVTQDFVPQMMQPGQQGGWMA